MFELPPPGQGFAALEMLNILEVCMPKVGITLAALGPSDPQYWHYLVEARASVYPRPPPASADVRFTGDRAGLAGHGVYRAGSDHQKDGEAVGW